MKAINLVLSDDTLRESVELLKTRGTCYAENCPIAHELRKTTGETWVVSQTIFRRSNVAVPHFDLSPDATKWIEDFDSWYNDPTWGDKPPTPFELEVWID